MLLPSKLVCHRDRLSQPALMSKIVSDFTELCAFNDKSESERARTKLTERKRERERKSKIRREEAAKNTFTVRNIKLVVECFESYHSHFDELGPQN